MRVLIYHPRFVGYGGAELVMCKVARALYARGYDVAVATHELDQTKYRMRTARIILPLSKPNILNNLVCSLSLSKLANQFDVLIMSNPYAVLDFFVSIRTKTPIVWWCHEPRRKLFWKEMGDPKPTDPMSWHLKRPLFKFLTKIFALHCRTLIVHSNYMKNIVRSALRVRGLRVVPFGVDLKDYPYTRLLKNKRLLYVGRVADVKNVYRLIEAFALVEDKQAGLVIIGQGTTGDNISMMRLVERLGLQEKVVWRKSVEDLIAEYVKSEMVVYPCINEPFGIVPIEAMATARPVIVARVGGPAETVVDGETGLLVDPYNKKEIANAITQILSKEDSFKMGMNGRKRVEDHYTFDRFLSGIENVLKEIVQKE
jgi:glycosyltransferase involved in cell wall biosynthesis